MGRRKKGTARRIVDRQMERSVLKLMPELPRLFQKLAAQVEAFDGSEPRTFLERVETDLTSKLVDRCLLNCRTWVVC